MQTLLGSILLFLCLAASATAAPNIVVILTDDQEDTGSMAYMPKVHSLIAEQGITFTNSFVNMPACAPSRVSFLTGQAAHNHGVKSNSARKAGGWPMFKDKEANALPIWLKAAGYKTAFLGKYVNDYGRKVEDEQRSRRGDGKSAIASWMAWLGGFLNSSSERPDTEARVPPVPAGWDLWYSFFPASSYFDYRIFENGKFLRFGSRPDEYSTDVLRGRAERFIREQVGTTTPFFMLVASKAPHGAKGEKGTAIPAPRHANLFADIGPLETPAFNEQDVSDKPRWLKNTESLDAGAKEDLKQSYRTEILSLQAIDDLAEGIVNALQDAGKLDDTVLIFTSDNGFLYGEHRLTGKFVAYEGAIRVPLVMKGPGIPKGQSRSQLVDNLDVVATIETLAGAVPGITPDGRPLTPLFVDANARWRSAILIEGGHEYDKPQKRFVAVRTKTRKYVRSGDGFEELYDLSADPHELENKAKDPSYSSEAIALRGLHDRLKSCVGSGCWIP